MKYVWSFLGIINYLSRFSPATAEVCEPPQYLKSIKVDYTYIKPYQNLYDSAKELFRKDKCMKFYWERQSPYLDVSGIGLDSGPLAGKR